MRACSNAASDSSETRHRGRPPTRVATFTAFSSPLSIQRKTFPWSTPYLSAICLGAKVLSTVCLPWCWASGVLGVQLVPYLGDSFGIEQPQRAGPRNRLNVGSRGENVVDAMDRHA